MGRSCKPFLVVWRVPCLGKRTAASELFDLSPMLSTETTPFSFGELDLRRSNLAKEFPPNRATKHLSSRKLILSLCHQSSTG